MSSNSSSSFNESDFQKWYRDYTNKEHQVPDLRAAWQAGRDDYKRNQYEAVYTPTPKYLTKKDYD